jgi:TIGR03009 family protein
MRYRWLSVMALLCAATLALGQPAARPQPPAPKLDDVLKQWEDAMSKITTLHTKVARKSVDKSLGGVELMEGEAKYYKPNKASIWLVNTQKPQDFERMICNAQLVYSWEPKLKEIHLYELEKPKQGQISDENFVSFLFGMKAAQAKARYQMVLQMDANYFYVDVIPVTPADKAEFSRARLVLVRTTGLPRQLWFEQPNQNETTWDFTKMVTNIQVDVREFDQPTPPAGWQLKRAPQADKPRVVRPGGVD